MSPISSITKFLNPDIKAGKFAEKVGNAIKPFQSADKLIAGIAMASVISKDAFSCYYYVTQSLKNEKIPEEKRKFVAALDLANGILNVGVQTAATFTLATQFDKFFDKFIAKTFKGDLEKVKPTAKTGFGLLAGLVLTQIVIKRVVVPLFATPMASAFKKKMEEKEKADKAKNGDKVEIKKDDKAVQQAIIDSTTPATKLADANTTATTSTNLLDRPLPKSFNNKL